MLFQRYFNAATFTACLVINQFSNQALAVDRSKFRTCEKTGFCRRNRRADFQPPQFVVEPESVAVVEGGLAAKIKATQRQDPPLNLKILFYENGIARMRVTEDTETPRWEPSDIVTEENLVSTSFNVLHANDPLVPSTLDEAPDDQGVVVSYGEGNILSVNFSPFQVSLYVDGQPQVVANAQNLMHFEQRQTNVASSRKALEGSQNQGEKQEEKEIVDYGEDGLALYADGTKEEKREVQEETHTDVDGDGPESFNGHTDTKPNGPTSVGIDITYVGYRQLYGLPEHASSLALKTTTGAKPDYDDPYRLYNLDVFEYELDNPMALYGAVPLVMGHKTTGESSNTVATFWFNPSETFVDVERTETDMRTRFISESGVVDLMMMPGPKPQDVFRQYADATGYPFLPPLFSLAYHQCRWNYKDEKDVLQVDAKFEELDFPYDVIWLDIEHTDDKRYFTWNKQLFPDPPRMQQAIADHGRRMVTIVDPHVKRDNNYFVHKTATERGYYVKNKDGNDFDGWCWPGSSSYLDFTNPEVRSWWSDQFSLENYKGSTLDLFTWNDMNEPSVFNGPEVSMSKDCKSITGIEHREWHNLYGIYFHRATAEGLVRRSPGQNERPFVLSRSFFAGTQRTGAIWTGDNAAEWSHLEIAAPMLLSMGVGGVPFVGADVGGFFGNPEPELLIRWYQAGSFQPFFRAHAHIETKRREPWVFGEPTTSMLRQAVMQRYTYLSYWYTLFYEGTQTGIPPMRPMWLEFPEDPQVLTLDDQWMVGSNLLVKPVVEQGQTKVDVYLPKDSIWYSELDAKAYIGKGYQSFDAPLQSIPVLQKGGSIIPRKFRLRRSSKLMHYDPFTLVIAPDQQGKAQGTLFMDDEHTFDYQRGSMKYMEFKYDNGELICLPQSSTTSSFEPENKIERVIILGQSRMPTSVTLKDPSRNQEIELNYELSEGSQLLTIRKPDINIAENWTINIGF